MKIRYNLKYSIKKQDRQRLPPAVDDFKKAKLPDDDQDLPKADRVMKLFQAADGRTQYYFCCDTFLIANYHTNNVLYLSHHCLSAPCEFLHSSAPKMSSWHEKLSRFSAKLFFFEITPNLFTQICAIAGNKAKCGISCTIAGRLTPMTTMSYIILCECIFLWA